MDDRFVHDAAETCAQSSTIRRVLKRCQGTPCRQQGEKHDGEAVENRSWQGRIEVESQPLLAGKGHPPGSTRRFGARLDLWIRPRMHPVAGGCCDWPCATTGRVINTQRPLPFS